MANADGERKKQTENLPKDAQAQIDLEATPNTSAPSHIRDPCRHHSRSDVVHPFDVYRPLRPGWQMLRDRVTGISRKVRVFYSTKAILQRNNVLSPFSRFLKGF